MKTVASQDVRADYKAILRASPWLSARSPEFQEGLLALGRLVELPEGAKLYRRGQVCDRLYALISGQIDVMMYAPNGIEIVSPNRTPGRWLVFSDVITKAPSASDGITRIPTLVLSISRKELVDFLDTDPRHYREVMTHDNEARKVLQRGFTIALTTVGEVRVAALLVSLFDADWLREDEPITMAQFEMAGMLGISVPTIQRAFRKLKRAGVLETSYGEWRITDLDTLRDFAETPPH